MAAIRTKLVEGLLDECIEAVNRDKLTQEELIVFIGQLVINSGHALYYKTERKEAQRPEKITYELANKLIEEDPTTGTSLMKIGFDIQSFLRREELESSTNGKEAS
jgi:hypothetical protein